MRGTHSSSTRGAASTEAEGTQPQPNTQTTIIYGKSRKIVIEGEYNAVEIFCVGLLGVLRHSNPLNESTELQIRGFFIISGFPASHEKSKEVTRLGPRGNNRLK